MIEISNRTILDVIIDMILKTERDYERAEILKYFLNFGYMVMMILKNGNKDVFDQYPELKQLGDWKVITDYYNLCLHTTLTFVKLIKLFSEMIDHTEDQ